MDLRPTPEQEQLRDTLRRLLDQRLTALVDALPTAAHHDRAQALADALAVGLLGLGLPEDVGGAGGFADLVVAHEELGRGLAPPLATTLTLAGRLVLRVTRTPTRDRLLADLAAGRLLAAPALEEGADPRADIATTATVSGDTVHVDGHKCWVVNGRDVDELLVLARDAAAGACVLLLVPADATGLEWTAEQSATEVPHWTVTFRGVTVPVERLLTDDAEAALSTYRTDATVLAAARLVGSGRAVLDRTVEHVKAREQFDRPIGTFQAVQHQLADVATELDATSLAVAQAGWAVEAGLPAAEAVRLAATALLAAGAAVKRATLTAHQLHGGMGFVLDSPLHLWSARAVADPTVPLGRRHLLDQLADASGITADAVTVPPDHRAASTPR